MEAEQTSENYISLQEATKLCNYSQEYLSLRARQGKLKAIKFGRNWVTKNEWLDEYLKRVEDFNEEFIKKTVKAVPPPENLPVEQERSFSDFDGPELTLVFSFAVISLVVIIFGVFYLSIFPNSSIGSDSVSAGLGNVVNQSFRNASRFGNSASRAIETILEAGSNALYRAIGLSR